MSLLFSDFRTHSAGWRDRSALVDAVSNLQLSYLDLAEIIESFGARLELSRIERGARITIVSQSAFQQVLAVIACLCNGVVANPLNPSLTKSQMTEFITHANPALILSDSVTAQRGCFRGRSVSLIDEALARKAPVTQCRRTTSAAGLLIYTSGTTGTAKAVLLSTKNIETNVATAAATFGYGPEWTSACLLPFYHTFGLVSDVLPMLLTGGKAVILPSFEMRHAKLAVESFRSHNVNSYSGPPVVFDAFLALRCLIDTRLRFAIAGAAPLRETTRIAYAECFGHPIVPCYGLTEATCFATISPPAAVKPGTVGKPANIEVAVRSESGQKAAVNETGEIALRGPSVIRDGYYNDGGRYGSAFTPDGWFLTGDIGRIDHEGYVYVTGRRKNMVIRGGEKVYLEDVDRHLSRYPGISDSVSIVISDSTGPDIAVSFVSCSEPSPNLRVALVRHIRDELGAGHVPDSILFVDTITRSPTGKVKPVELRALYESRNHDDY